MGHVAGSARRCRNLGEDVKGKTELAAREAPV